MSSLNESSLNNWLDNLLHIETPHIRNLWQLPPAQQLKQLKEEVASLKQQVTTLELEVNWLHADNIAGALDHMPLQKKGEKDRCVVCPDSTSSYMCPGCNVWLHPQCFRDYHRAKL